MSGGATVPNAQADAAARLIVRWELLDPAARPVTDVLPARPSRVLDAGA
ncbi:hypothetical protein HKCCE3408_07140 [Rhodobacterales bacterium HKCCE3408]|nr:hypothetical protein [Rhodobacterales bacterium HKCCE3408]